MMDLRSGGVAPVRALAEAIRARVAGSVDDVEVRVERADQVAYSLEGAVLVPELEVDAVNVAMRARVRGRTAVAAVTGSSVDEAVGAIRAALAAAEPDGLDDFPVLDGCGDVDARGWDDATAALVDRPSAVRERAAAMAKAAEGARRSADLVLEGSVGVARAWRAMATGRGETVLSARTSASAYLLVDGSEWDSVASIADPGVEAAAELGAKLTSTLPTRIVGVAEWLGASRECVVVLDPRLVETLLRALLLERVGLDRVLAGLSPAAVGDVVAAPAFSLFDDPSATGSLAGHVVDDEGVRGRRKAVIEGGVLRTLLSDRRSAKMAGGVATAGNGFRIPLMSEDAGEAPVRVAMGHLEVPAGDVPRASLVRGRTVLLSGLLGVHSANKSTGAFNNPLQGGVALEDGVPVARLRAGAWSARGNVHELLRGIEGLSVERMHTGAGTLPWVAAPVRLA